MGGSEGLFAIDLEAPETQWPARQVMTTEVSEMVLFDIDGDGSDELVTIEPFHGSALRAYKHSDRGWKPHWDAELEFGHCVLAGQVGGVRSIIASSRSGSRSLFLFQFEKTGEGRPARIVVDPGAGAANMILLRHEGRDHIFATNQAEGEIAVYTPS